MGEERFAKADGQSNQVECDEHQIGFGDVPVQVFLVDGAAFGRHIEFTDMRSDKRNRRRNEDVPRENRLINALEERISVSALEHLVGDGRVNHVRNHVCEDRSCRCIDDVNIREHVWQRRDEKN